MCRIYGSNSEMLWRQGLEYHTPFTSNGYLSDMLSYHTHAPINQNVPRHLDPRTVKRKGSLSPNCLSFHAHEQARRSKHHQCFFLKVMHRIDMVSYIQISFYSILGPLLSQYFIQIILSLAHFRSPCEFSFPGGPTPVLSIRYRRFGVAGFDIG